jgi:hypothetical protein
MGSHAFHGHRAYLFRDQACESLMNRHTQGADTLPAKSDGGSQHEVGTIRFQQICGADIGLKALSDESDYVHEGFGGLAATRRQLRTFFHGQNIARKAAENVGADFLNCLFVSVQGHILIIDFVQWFKG